MGMESNKLLEIKDLKVSFYTPAGEVKAVDGISYDLNEHEEDPDGAEPWR